MRAPVVASLTAVFPSRGLVRMFGQELQQPLQDVVNACPGRADDGENPSVWCREHSWSARLH